MDNPGPPGYVVVVVVVGQSPGVRHAAWLHAPQNPIERVAVHSEVVCTLGYLAHRRVDVMCVRVKHRAIQTASVVSAIHRSRIHYTLHWVWRLKLLSKRCRGWVEAIVKETVERLGAQRSTDTRGRSDRATERPFHSHPTRPSWPANEGRESESNRKQETEKHARTAADKSVAVSASVSSGGALLTCVYVCVRVCPCFSLCVLREVCNIQTDSL